MKSIVVATDFSPNAMHAVHRAALVARATRAARLELVHVLPAATRWSGWIGHATDTAARFEHAGKRLGALSCALQTSDVAVVERRIVARDRVATIMGAAAHADLLVVGAPARRSLLHPMLGSTRRVLHGARAPVLVVRKPPASPYRDVLVAVDLSTKSDEAFVRARTVAPGARFDVVHAYRAALEGRLQYAGASAGAVERHRSDALRTAVSGLGELLRSQTSLPEPAAHVVHGHAAFALLDKERELRADLVVVWRPARTLVGEWLVPSVTSRLLEEGSSDVLVVQP